MRMNKETAELVFWTLQSHYSFSAYFDQDREDYLKIKIARVQISDRYRELIKDGYSFSESDQLATNEWLMELDIQNGED